VVQASAQSSLPDRNTYYPESSGTVREIDLILDEIDCRDQPMRKGGQREGPFSKWCIGLQE